MFRFAEPVWLIFLVLPFWYFFSYFTKKGGKDSTIIFSNTHAFKFIHRGHGPLKRVISLFLFSEAIFILILAMARPQTGFTYNVSENEGIDIIITLDISSSMDILDFHPLTRLEAAKDVINEFLGNRTSDRIGLVVFAAYPFTLAPLTTDYNMISTLLDNAKESNIEDGTAIGSAIAASLNRLRDSDSKNKIIILLTDGINNYGSIDPLTAARIAGVLDVRIYTIGVGTENKSLMTREGRFLITETQLDEQVLKEIAHITNGKYYRATDRNQLRGIYREIDNLETSRYTTKEWVEHADLYPSFLRMGFLLLMLFILFETLLIKRLP